MDQREHACGVCAILGVPNVGKSTLLNRLLGVHLAAVSRKPQTTRTRILGVKTSGINQVVYLDTPGLQQGKTELRRYMRKQTLNAASGCNLAIEVMDVIALLREGVKPSAFRHIHDELPTILAINKMDRLSDKSRLLPLLEAISQSYHTVIPISAKVGDGLERLERAVEALLPVGPWLFPEDMYTDQAERFIAGELIREQVFQQLGQEVPYTTAVEVQSFEERGRDIVVDAIVHVERASHKMIVVGTKGTKIRDIGVRARAVLAGVFGCPVHVRLFVKVSSKWTQTREGVRQMGYQE